MLRCEKPFFATLYSWPAPFSLDAEVAPPPMVSLTLKWLADKFAHQCRFEVGRPVLHLGEAFRAGAKVEGSRVVLGGWEVLGGGGNTVGSLVFSGTEQGRHSMGLFSGRHVPLHRSPGIPRHAIVRRSVPAWSLDAWPSIRLPHHCW